MDSGRSGRLTYGQSRELWRRWREGQTLTEIAAALSSSPASVFAMIRRQGGYSPPVRTRSERSLSIEDREEVSRGLSAGDSFRAIAARIGRSASTVNREISRNGGREWYRAADADGAAWSRRPKECLLAREPRLRAAVAAKLAEDWSPEQISGWLRSGFGDDASMRVSHESIYRSLFVQARGVLKKEGAPSPLGPADAAVAACHDQGPGAGHDQGRRADQRAPRGGGGSRGAGPLGGRLAGGIGQHVHRDSSGAAVSLHDPRESGVEGDRDGGEGARAAGEDAARAAEEDAVVGPRDGDGRARRLRGRDRREGLLLRSAETMAARDEREHEWTAAAVLSEGDGSLGLLAGEARPGGAEAERTSEGDARLQHARKYDGPSVAMTG